MSLPFFGGGSKAPSIPPPPPPPPPVPTVDDARAAADRETAGYRRRGRAATILTSTEGALTPSANIGAKTLLGS